MVTKTSQLCALEFGAAFDAADDLIVTEIYPAGEKPIPGVDAGMIVERVAARGTTPVRCIGDREEIVRCLLSEVREGDIVFTLGAGDLNRFAEELVSRLSEKQGAG